MAMLVLTRWYKSRGQWSLKIRWLVWTLDPDHSLWVWDFLDMCLLWMDWGAWCNPTRRMSRFEQRMHGWSQWFWHIPGIAMSKNWCPTSFFCSSSCYCCFERWSYMFETKQSVAKSSHRWKPFEPPATFPSFALRQLQPFRRALKVLQAESETCIYLTGI